METRTHSTSSVSATCQNCKDDFVIEPDDFGFYEKIKVPPPTWCPQCRAIRRMTWRNERSLYRNTCAFSGKPIISMFAPESKLTVYERDIWWSDKWDPTTYGMDYDFSRPFLEQFRELMQKVPLMNLGNTNCVQSDYGNHNADIKNSYLVYACFSNENIFYSNGLVNVKDSWDLYKCTKSEQCYDTTLCASSYNTHFSYDSDECINCLFVTSCLGLNNCLGCINLRHKSYFIFNKQYSKEEYEQKLKDYDLGSYIGKEKFMKEYAEFIKNEFRRFAFIYKSQNVTGDNIMNAKNSKMVFDIHAEVENSKYVTHIWTMRESYDAYGAGAGAELIYEAVDCGIDVSKDFFTVLNHGSIETAYTYMCFSSKYLFGCIGMQKQDHCILNKKYTKEEYDELLPKILKHMEEMPYIDARGRVYKYGEFFPPELSPFAYNETIAQEYFPKTEAESIAAGFTWKETQVRDYNVEIMPENLPDHIKDVDESMVGKIIGCMHAGQCHEQCTEAFKILPDELRFYNKINVPLPRLCPNCRHYQRLAKRNPLQLWHRSCMCGSTGSPQVTSQHFHGEGKCEVEFETSYAPERPEIIYCEKCYQQEVY